MTKIPLEDDLSYCCLFPTAADGHEGSRRSKRRRSHRRPDSSSLHAAPSRAVRLVAAVHLVCVALCSIAVAAAASSSSSSSSDPSRVVCGLLPRNLQMACFCTPAESGGGGVRIVCKGLDSTAHLNLLDTEEEDDDDGRGNSISGGNVLSAAQRRVLANNVREIVVKDSAMETAHLSDFGAFAAGLRSFTLTDSEVNRLASGPTIVSFPSVQTIDLSGNGLSEVDLSGFGDGLREVNLSGNALRHPPPGVFSRLGGLQVLDLSGNNLDEDVDKKLFTSLPKTIRYLDISSESAKHLDATCFEVSFFTRVEFPSPASFFSAEIRFAFQSRSS